MKRIALAAVAAVLLPVAAAHADPFAVAYGNTVTQTMPNGSKTVIYVNADKTWERHEANGTVLKGTYSWKDDTHACFTQTDPAPADPSKTNGCDEIKGEHKVGETWTEPMGNGQNITMSITAGR